MLKSGQTDALALPEYRKELALFNKNFSFDDLVEIFKEIVKTNQLLADNLNIKLPLFIIKERLRWANS